MVDFMVDKWTNFAIHHNPTPKNNAWPTYGSNGITYVRLDESKIITQRDTVRDERLKFSQIGQYPMDIKYVTWQGHIYFTGNRE